MIRWQDDDLLLLVLNVELSANTFWQVELDEVGVPAPRRRAAPGSLFAHPLRGPLRGPANPSREIGLRPSIPDA